MSLNLSNLKPAKGATHKRKDIGRGGKRGSYSGKGMKGQGSRSGVSGLTALGMKQIFMSVPKTRGFKSLKPKLEVINLSEIEKNFKAGDIVDARKMIQAGIVRTAANGIKVLATGSISKKLTVRADAFSAKAKQAIIDAGGEVFEPKKVEKAAPKKSQKK